MVRAAHEQQLGLALAKTGLAHAGTRPLARSMVRVREATLALLAGPLGRVAVPGAVAGPGQTSGDDVTPEALRRARPFERAFLLVMLRDGEAMLALASTQLRRGKDPEIRALAQRISVDSARESARVRRAWRRLPDRRVDLATNAGAQQTANDRHEPLAAIGREPAGAA